MEGFDIVLFQIHSDGVGDRTGVTENVITKSVFDHVF